MTVKEIYKKYNTMSSVANHMLSVAALTKHIFEIKNITDGEDYIKAALLHDIGKMVSFKLGHIPNSLGNKPLEYWQKIQNDMREQYGTDSEKVTQKIFKELNISEKLLDIIRLTRFVMGNKVNNSENLKQKIITYADQRITPFGIAPLQYRLAEGAAHFESNAQLSHEDNLKIWIPLSKSFYSIEKSIFNNNEINPDEITDADLKEHKQGLLYTEI